MFRFFRAEPFVDPELGKLERSRGYWRGQLSIDGVNLPLALHGPRAAPDATALSLARTIAAQLPSWKPAIAQALFAHYAPYAEAAADGDIELPPFERLAAPADVWAHVSASHVLVEHLDGAAVIEIGYRTGWDDEHTVGARIRDGRLIELNGSVLAP